MKILFLSPQPFFVERGTPIDVLAAVEALAADGHRIDLLTYHEGRDHPIRGVRHLRIRRPPLVRRVPIGPSWQKAVCDLWLLRDAWRLAARNGYDLVHAVEESVFIARLLKRRFGLPFIYDMDSLMSEQIADKSPLLRPASWVFRGLETGAIRESAGVLPVCPALVDESLRRCPSANVVLLSDMPMCSAEGQRPAPELAAIGGTRLVYVGNLEAYQGVDVMVSAFASIAAEHPDAALIVIGGDEAGAARLKRIAPRLCDAGRIRFMGPRPLAQLGSILAAADIVVSPRSAGRNTPMKLYSYLESGRPVLATRLPTHTQVLDDAVAVLVEPEAAAMAAGMRRLIESPALRARIGAAGQELVRREYAPPVYRGRLRAFYSEVERQIGRGLPAPATPTLAITGFTDPDGERGVAEPTSHLRIVVRPAEDPTGVAPGAAREGHDAEERA